MHGSIRPCLTSLEFCQWKGRHKSTTSVLIFNLMQRHNSAGYDNTTGTVSLLRMLIWYTNILNSYTSCLCYMKIEMCFFFFNAKQGNTFFKRKLWSSVVLVLLEHWRKEKWNKSWKRFMSWHKMCWDRKCWKTYLRSFENYLY